jgi:hypothetical protein
LVPVVLMLNKMATITIESDCTVLATMNGFGRPYLSRKKIGYAELRKKTNPFNPETHRDVFSGSPIDVCRRYGM